MRTLLWSDRRWRVVGAAVGASFVVALLASARVAAGPGSLGAELRMRTSPTGELSVSTRDAFLHAADLRPGRPTAGRVLVRNQTGASLAVVGRIESSSTDLDDQVHVRITADDVVTSDGTLGEAADGTRPFELAPGHEAVLVVDASLVPGANRYQGRTVDAHLRLAVERVTG